MSRDRDFRNRIDAFQERQLEKALAKGHGTVEKRLAREAAAAKKKGAKLSREQIAAAALAIADAQGFEAVSMRKIATILGAGTMSLYHYVRTKDDLIAIMDDAIMGEVLIPDALMPKHWRPALTAIARRTREGFMRHPWAMFSLDRGPPGRNGVRHFEQSLAAVANTGIPYDQRLELILLVDDYVFGHVLRTPAVVTHTNLDPNMNSAFREFAEGLIATGAFPNIKAMAEVDPSGGMDALSKPEMVIARFERGLTMLLDGAAIAYGLPAE